MGAKTTSNGKLGFIFLSFFIFSSAKAAQTLRETEIHVTLLGQPCMLQGPADEGTLKLVHGIGPAQFYPTLDLTDLAESRKQIKEKLERLEKLDKKKYPDNVPLLPDLLEQYRTKLMKRLEAQGAFLDGLDQLKRTHKSTALINSQKKYSQKRQNQELSNLIQKLGSPKLSPSLFSETAERAFDLYNEAIIPDPETAFHRGIKNLNIQYHCSFEESEEPEGE